ncbi:helix-turn-helix domain-containing protein [Saccharopolyspora cebuensis]|uniref:Helix-turn-helix domain-containing protein n=1 Tax=Saccharopolyspora cebuensis TaxID=418759 RepID=A0ABV4CG03_9PSEU
MTTRDVAKALAVSPRTVARWVERGWITPDMTLPSGHHRFRLDEVKRQLREHGGQREP